MSNVIQFLPITGPKLEREIASDVSLCLLLASWYNSAPTSVRTEIIEIVLEHCDKPHLTRLALRAQGEAV